MDELRNLVIIIPALGAILISLIWFVLNYPYNEIKNIFNPIIREHSKVEAIIIVIIIGFYSILGIFFLLGIILLPFLESIKNDGINDRGNLYFQLLWFIGLIISYILVIIIRANFEKKLLITSCREKKKIKFWFGVKSLIVILICSTLIIMGFICRNLIFGENIIIKWNNNEIFTKVSMNAFNEGYRNNVYIYVDNKAFKLYDTCDLSEELNIIRISSINKNLYVSKDFNISISDSIELKEGDEYIVKYSYKSYGKWIGIIEAGVIIILPTLALVYMCGMNLALRKIYSIKKYKIKISMTTNIGELWFVYDDFYLIKIYNEFKYIAKKDISELEPVEYKNNMQIEKIKKLKSNEIYNLKQLREWEVYLNIKEFINNCVYVIKNITKKFFINIKKLYNKILLIYKIILVVLIIIIIIIKK